MTHSISELPAGILTELGDEFLEYLLFLHNSYSKEDIERIAGQVQASFHVKAEALVGDQPPSLTLPWS